MVDEIEILDFFGGERLNKKRNIQKKVGYTTWIALSDTDARIKKHKFDSDEKHAIH